MLLAFKQLQIDEEKVLAVNGSKNVKVTCSLNHGLSIGDAVSVQGLSQYQAEGFFIVTSVPSSLTCPPDSA